MFEPNEKREMVKYLSLNGYQKQGQEYQRKTPYFTHYITIVLKENSVELSDRYQQYPKEIPKPQQFRGFVKFFAELKTRIEVCNKHIMVDPPFEQPTGDYSYEYFNGEWTLFNKTLVKTDMSVSSQ